MLLPVVRNRFGSYVDALIPGVGLVEVGVPKSGPAHLSSARTGEVPQGCSVLQAEDLYFEE